MPFECDGPAKLTGQFIAFTISSERERFLASLKKASSHPIQYMTLFRKGATPHEAKAKGYASCVTTADGYMIVDEQFFNDFQLDAEEA